MQQSATISADAPRLIRNGSVVSREVLGETIVVPICQGVGDMEAVFTFNSLGTQLWRLLSQTRSEAELVSWVTENFSVTAEQAACDVNNFLSDLKETGLVQAAAEI